MRKKDVFTTGQVAEICNVAPRTVTKWFDSGQLKGYRIPGSRDRRIPINELKKFMKANSIPTEMLDQNYIRVIVVDSNSNTFVNQFNELESRYNFKIELAVNSFEAGMLITKTSPHVVFLTLSSAEINVSDICTGIIDSDTLTDVKIVAVGDNLGTKELEALKKRGFYSVIDDITNLESIVDAIQDATSILQC